MNERDRKRFLPKCRPQGPGGCILWGAAIGGDGYGRFRYRNRIENAHRVAWMMANGPVPNGLFVLHRCDNRVCVNPNHLFVGDQAANMADMAKKRRGRGPAVLTPSQVIEIRRALSLGRLPETKIAGVYGVSPTTINCIRRRATWRHVQ